MLATPVARFDLVHVLWYAGGLIVIGAMGLFTTVAFSLMGGKALILTGLAYGLGLFIFGHRLWHDPTTRLPGGILIAGAVSMVPMIVFGLQQETGWWAGQAAPGQFRDFYHFVKGGFVPMEIATIATSMLALRRYPFAFLAFPAALCLLFLSMDLTEWIAENGKLSWALRRDVSLWFGMVLFSLTLLLEQRRQPADYAFWLHLVAAITFWSGLTFRESDSEIGKVLYCFINMGLLAVAIFMRRRVYAVFGVIGITIYLGHLAEKVFRDSLLFPFALSLIGLAIVGLGILHARRRAGIEGWIEAHIPASLRQLRPYGLRSSPETSR